MSILSTIARATSHTDPNPSAYTEIETGRRIRIETGTGNENGIGIGIGTKTEEETRTETETEIGTAIVTGIRIRSCRLPTATSTFPTVPQDLPG